MRTPLVLSESEWMSREAEHARRVRRWTEPHRARASRGEKHPVHDFLFSYYAFRPAWLERWHPGPDVVLSGASAGKFATRPGYRRADDGVVIDLASISAKRRESIAWIRDLLTAMQQRPPFFACFGLHEWAMVFEMNEEQRRHQQWPLRFEPAELARIVKSQPVCCTHFDAFRFFTGPARPLNRVQPTRATSSDHEQRGCLHANMDLYKWAFKLAPFTPSELVADCFELARDIREVDMRASPYDLQALGFEPIRIESPEGRADYERRQREFSTRGEPLRARLVALCTRMLEDCGGEQAHAHREAISLADGAARC